MIDVFHFDKTLKRSTAEDLNKLKDKAVWIDITSITKEEGELIKNAFGLHPLTAEDLVSQNTRIKVEEFPGYLFCIFYAIQKKRSIHLAELDFILGRNFLITNHKAELPSYSSLKDDKERFGNLFSKGLDFLFHRLLDMEVDNYFPVLESIDDDIEHVEESIARKPKPELLTRILKLKRQIVHIKKVAFQQREKISFIAKNSYKQIPNNSIPYFRDIYDHAIRVSDTLDNYREAVGNTFDAYMSAVSNNMNEVMKILSVIATIALPLTVISGIYGTNFDILPGQRFVYSFWIMILGMTLLSAGMIYMFKRRKWF